jgi:signal transduction histidine kinase
MNQMILEGADEDRGVAPTHLALTLIDVIDRLHPLVESPYQDRLLTAKEQLADFARPASPPAPASGVFVRRQLLDRQSMGELVDRQLTEAKLIACGGALHDAVNTLTFLQGPQIQMKQHAMKLSELEPHFLNLTPLGSVEGRLDFIQAALKPVEGIGQSINTVLRGISEIRTALSEASGDFDAAERAVQALVARGGRVDGLRKVIRKLMRSEIPQVLLLLHRTELERKEDEGGLSGKTREAYRYHLSELRNQLGALRGFLKLGLDILEKFSQIGEISRQGSCPFPVDLAESLNEELLRWVVGRGVDLKLNIDEPRWLVPGPSESLWQVVVNLVNNARQAMQDSGRLKISVLPVQLTDAKAARSSHHYATGTPRAGDYVLLSVRDSGPGIPRDALARLFDLFYSTNHSGYGLAAVRQIVEDMGGFIGVDSATGEPHGTVFSIYFPRAV